MRFLNASVLLHKSLNRNLSWGFPLGDLLPKTRVLERCVSERKRKRFRSAPFQDTKHLGVPAIEPYCETK